MTYIMTHHYETAQYMYGCSWTGGFTNSRPGTSTYTYTSNNGWTVTMTNAIGNNQVYSVTVTYEKHPYWWSTYEKVVVSWLGTWQYDTVRQTSYWYTP